MKRPRPTVTHTEAELPVSQLAFREIRDKLVEGGYVAPGDTELSIHGTRLVLETGAPSTWSRLAGREEEAVRALDVVDLLDDWWSDGGAGEICIRLDAPEDHAHVRCFQRKTGDRGDVFIVGVGEPLSAALADYAVQDGMYDHESGTVPHPPRDYYDRD